MPNFIYAGIYLVHVDKTFFLSPGEDSADILVFALRLIISLDDENSLPSPSAPFAPTPLSPP